ncbi:hypothetical protein LIER_36768 [Lithospermum erythrorhizon]|uniref:Uncharacterized protein n=1 Tax=Lithospermum erythrorhizon TaxID=34254 RepID=A0AAV3PB27_LITER
MRPIMIMSITYNSGSPDAVAVGNVAERIMQTTPERISELAKMGETYNRSSVRSDFENKIFLMLLHQSAGKKPEIQRRPLLVAYYDETSDDKGKSTDNTLSPLKCQMNRMAINPESSSKRQLTMMPTHETPQNEDSTIIQDPETRSSGD